MCCLSYASVYAPTSLFLKFRKSTTPLVTEALPFNWMTVFFLLIKKRMAKSAQRRIQGSFMLPSPCARVAAAAGIPPSEPPAAE